MPQPGYVYMVHGVGTCFVKIGQALNLIRRLGELQRGVPFTLQLLTASLVRDMDTEEKQLLQKYQEYRTRGEWFELPKSLLQHWPIDTPSTVLFPPQGVQESSISPSQLGEETHRILSLINERHACTLQAIYEGMEVVSRQHRQQVNTILSRLVKAKRITKASRGIYRSLDYSLWQATTWTPSDWKAGYFTPKDAGIHREDK